MKTSTLLILGVAGLAGFLWFRNDAKKGPKKDDGKPKQADFVKYPYEDIKGWAERQTILRKNQGRSNS